VGTSLSPFTEEELLQLSSLVAGLSDAVGSLAPSPAHILRTVLEGCTYLLETATFNNLKTASFGQALLEIGVSQERSVVFGNVWTAGSSVVVNRLKAKPLGAPLVLQGSSFRIALNLGSTAATGQRETATTLDLELASAGTAEAEGRGEVLSLELGRANLEELLAKLDAIQAQADSLSG